MIETEIASLVSTDHHGEFDYSLDERSAQRFVLAVPAHDTVDLTFEPGKELDYEREKSFYLVVVAEPKGTSTTATSGGRVTIKINIQNVEEAPEVLDDYNVGDSTTLPGREIYVLAQSSSTSPITIFATQVFRDPEGNSIRFKQCADDFKVSEFDYGGTALTSGASGVRGSRGEDATTLDVTGRARHCPDPSDTTNYDATKDVTRGGMVANLQTFGQQIRINPVYSGVAGVRRAVIDFHGWSITPVNTSSDNDLANTSIVGNNLPVSGLARITVWVKTGSNNRPQYAATGFRANISETLGDAEVLVGPSSTGSWNARDLDSEDNINLMYSLSGTSADTECSDEESAVAIGTNGCLWLVTTKDTNTNINNVAIRGKRLDYETAINGVYSVTLTASDGWGVNDQASVPITIVVANVNEPIEYSGAPNAIRQLVVGRQGRSVDLNDVFSDPDRTPITYSATSNNPTLVTATLNGSILTVSPVAEPGSTFITVQASSTGNDVSVQSLPVTVRSTNRAPFFRNNAIELASDNVSENAAVGTLIQVRGAQYADPEGDAVTATVTNSDLFQAVVDPSIGDQKQEGLIALRLLGTLDFETNQEHIVTISLSDGWDESPTSVNVRVQVTNVNEPPYLATDSNGNTLQIPDQTVAVGGTKSLRCQSVFR